VSAAHEGLSALAGIPADGNQLHAQVLQVAQHLPQFLIENLFFISFFSH